MNVHKTLGLLCFLFFSLASWGQVTGNCCSGDQKLQNAIPLFLNEMRSTWHRLYNEKKSFTKLSDFLKAVEEKETTLLLESTLNDANGKKCERCEEEKEEKLEKSLYSQLISTTSSKNLLGSILHPIQRTELIRHLQFKENVEHPELMVVDFIHLESIGSK